MVKKKVNSERLKVKSKKKAKTSVQKVDLSVNLAGIKLKNPVLVASGTFNCGEEYGQLYDLEKLGGIITKAVTGKRRVGNPPPRMAETPAGMLNTIGLQNEGVDYFIRSQLPPLLKKDLAVIVNVAGSTVEEYAVIVKKLSRFGGLAGIELNVSCPNVHQGGLAFGADPNALREVVQAVKRQTTLPLLVKLSPNVTDIVALARVAMDAGADGLSLINTLLGMAINTVTQEPELSMKVGGLSGPAIKPVAVRMVYQVFKALKCPIIGMGGIASIEDGVEFMLAGSTAIAVGTTNFTEPLFAANLAQGLADHCAKKHISSVNELIGAVKD